VRETEIIYRRLFEACGNCFLVDQVKDLYREMQSIKNLETDKVTYATYYQALMKCKDAVETQSVNNGLNRSSTEGRKSNPSNSKLPPRQANPFQAVSSVVNTSGLLDTSD